MKLMLALTVLSVSVLLAQQAPVSDTVRNPLAGDPAAVTAGQQVYNQTCQACHGPAGQGDRAVALNTPTFVQGSDDGDIFHSIRAGIPNSQMPAFPRLTDVQTWQLVSYVRSLQGAAPAARASAATTAPVAGDAAAGETAFFGRASCSGCHEVNGRGGITGPDLSAAARLSTEALRQKIVAPNTPLPAGPAAGGRGGGRGAPPPVTLVVKTQDGRELRGVRRSEDNFSLQMIDVDGHLQLLDKAKLASITVENKSLMPSDHGTRLTAAEVTNLVAYLHGLTGRDLTKTAAQPMTGGITFDRLKNSKAEPQNWLMYWGDFQGTHYSSLNQITTANVKNLQGAWTSPVPGNTTLEATPVVVDGVMYVTSSGDPFTVMALDARTGRQIWRYSRPQKVKNPYEINPYNRGVAVLGNRLFIGTLDAALISLDARTGLLMWETQVADSMEGYSITSAPLIVKDKVVTGITGGEFATRGFLQAFDAASGKPAWKFYTIPGPGEPGNDTWKGDSWKTGGSPTWLTGSYDPDLNLIYWAVGNPAAQIDRSVRGDGDNLYSDSVVAVDGDTGQLKWHYQFTPNDGHDWDSVQDMVLVDRVWHGQNRKLLLHADRNSHFYVLDRTNGAFLSATPFVYQNWNKGFDAKGHPMPLPGSNSSPEGSFLVYPQLGGGTNFNPPSYSPQTGWLYLPYQESGAQFTSAPVPIERGRQYIGRAPGRGAAPARGPNDPAPSAGVKALNPEDGKTMWEFKVYQGSLNNGLMATGGGLVFVLTREGNFFALDAKTGKHLWHFLTGTNPAAAPMSYAVDGRQYIAVSAGNTVFSFALPEEAVRPTN